VIPACEGAQSIDFGCYQRRYRALGTAAGPRAAARDLVRRARRVGYVRVACHQLMHGIGRDAGRRTGLTAFAQGDESCSSGFYHGVVEAVMARLGARVVEREPAQVCAPFRRRAHYGLAHYNCVHGMGHGFMGVFASNLFRSLDACGALPDRWERDQCVGGVFMENLTALGNARRPSRALRPEQPLYPCTAVAARYKHECYMKQTAYALLVRGDDFGAVFRLCARSPDVAFRDDCYEGLGGDASIVASKYVTGAKLERATTRELCRLGPTAAARRHCVIGAVTVMVRDGAAAAAKPAVFCGGFREVDLHAACSRAHLEIVQEFARQPAALTQVRGRSPQSICVLAGALETKGLGMTRDNRKELR
jgi:hypothetical protein